MIVVYVLSAVDCTLTTISDGFCTTVAHSLPIKDVFEPSLTDNIMKFHNPYKTFHLR